MSILNEEQERFARLEMQNHNIATRFPKIIPHCVLSTMCQALLSLITSQSLFCLEQLYV